MINTLLKNMGYVPEHLVGKVIRITNNYMCFYRPPTFAHHLVWRKVGNKRWSSTDDVPNALKVNTKWMIWEFKDDEVLVANFRDPKHQFWIPIKELEKSARLIA